MGHVKNADGSLVINPTPKTVEDLQKIADLAMDVGGVWKGTSAQRQQLTSSETRAGWLLSETDTGRVFLRTATEPQGLLVLEDTGWVTVGQVAGTNFVPNGAGVRFRRKNGVVFFNVTGTLASWVDNWSITAIPVGFRPEYMMTFASSYNDVAHEVQFMPAGNVVIAKEGSGGITVSGSYPVA